VLRVNGVIVKKCLVVLALMGAVNYLSSWAEPFCGGGIWAKHPKSSNALFRIVENDKIGYIDAQGQISITPRFELSNVNENDFTGDFFDGLANLKKNRKWGYIDSKGIQIIPPIYPQASEFSEGSAHVGGCEYIDKTGKSVLKPKCLYGTPLVFGLAHVRISELDWAYIDRTGRIVFSYHAKP
jgi:hypothetical protein